MSLPKGTEEESNIARLKECHERKQKESQAKSRDPPTSPPQDSDKPPTKRPNNSPQKDQPNKKSRNQYHQPMQKQSTQKLCKFEERQHWITTALMHGKVCVFDSCFNGQLTASAELQIVQMYRPLIEENTLLVTVMPIQQQEPGFNSCRLFSIAAAYHAANGDSIKDITFSEQRMRSHLIKCFEREKLTAFPKARSPTS